MCDVSASSTQIKIRRIKKTSYDIAKGNKEWQHIKIEMETHFIAPAS